MPWNIYYMKSHYMMDCFACADVSLKVIACAESCAADVTACAAEVTEVLSPPCREILKN